MAPGYFQISNITDNIAIVTVAEKVSVKRWRAGLVRPGATALWSVATRDEPKRRGNELRKSIPFQKRSACRRCLERGTGRVGWWRGAMEDSGGSTF